MNIENKTQDYAKIKIDNKFPLIRVINMIRVEYIDKISIYIKFHEIEIKRIWRKILSGKLEYCIKSRVNAINALKKGL